MLRTEYEYRLRDIKLAVFIAQYKLEVDSTSADMQSNLRNTNVIMIWNIHVVTPVYQAFTPTDLHIDLPQIIQGACQMYAMSVAHTPTCVNNYFHSRNEATGKRKQINIYTLSTNNESDFNIKY